MMSEGGGVNTPIGSGHIKARDLYDQMQAFRRGLEFSHEQA
jgi:hypothetical protein